MDYELEYTDIIKAYQARSNDFLNQLITAEAKLHASAGFIKKLKDKISELEEENKKLSQKNIKTQKKVETKTEEVIDYN